MVTPDLSFGRNDELVRPRAAPDLLRTTGFPMRSDIELLDLKKRTARLSNMRGGEERESQLIGRIVARITSGISMGVLEREDEGQGMAEYGLILAGVALLAIVAVFLLGPKIGDLMNKIASSLS